MQHGAKKLTFSNYSHGDILPRDVHVTKQDKPKCDGKTKIFVQGVNHFVFVTNELPRVFQKVFSLAQNKPISQVYDTLAEPVKIGAAGEVLLSKEQGLPSTLENPNISLLPAVTSSVLNSSVIIRIEDDEKTSPYNKTAPTIEITCDEEVTVTSDLKFDKVPIASTPISKDPKNRMKIHEIC